MSVMSSPVTTQENAAFCHPYGNTGTKYQNGAGGDSQRCIIDWLTCTFIKPENFSLNTLISLLGDYMQADVRGVDSGKGMYGFQHRIDLEVCIDDEYKGFGYLAWGGKSQLGHCMLDITGEGCGLIKDWEALQDTLESINATPTRVDLALDFLNGERTIDDALEMAKAGDFNMNGSPPEYDFKGDWFIDGSRGRTMYVGQRVSGKQLCIYEKGKQLGDKESNWTRYELRLGNKGRVIPLDILTDSDKYFAGAYSAFAEMLQGVEPQRIKTITIEAQVTLSHLLRHMKRCYGKAINKASKLEEFNIEEFLITMTVRGLPNRLDLSAANLDLYWQDLKERLHDERNQK